MENLILDINDILEDINLSPELKERVTLAAESIIETRKGEISVKLIEHNCRKYYNVNNIIKKHNIRNEIKTRKREIVLYRQTAIWLIKQHFPMTTLRDLGNMFEKDHATAIHALKTISNLLDTNREIRYDIAMIEKAIQDDIKKAVIQNKIFI